MPDSSNYSVDEQYWKVSDLAAWVSERVPFATRVSDWWIAHFPSGFVSYRDFDDSTIPHATLDTSATAIVGVRDRTQVALKAREPGLL